jgi:hypothetical protein
VAKFFEHCTIEIFSIIDGDLLRDSVTTNDALLGEFLDGGGGYLSYMFHFDPFSEVLYCDNGEGVIPLCWCEFVDDIDAPLLQGPGWGYQP